MVCSTEVQEESNVLTVYGIGLANKVVMVNPKAPCFASAEHAQEYIDNPKKPLGKIVVQMRLVLPEDGTN